MRISDTIRATLEAKGITQTWVITRMNMISPAIEMNRSKFSAIVCGTRKMTGEELLAFCKATQTNPDVFIDTNELIIPG